MKTIGTTIAALALAIGLSACSADDEPKAEPTTEVTVTETAEPEPAPETGIPSGTEDDIFLAVLSEKPHLYGGLPESDLIDLGHQTCDLLDMGHTVDDIFMELAGAGVDPEFGGYLVGAGVGAYCPEYSGMLG